MFVLGLYVVLSCIDAGLAMSCSLIKGVLSCHKPDKGKKRRGGGIIKETRSITGLEIYARIREIWLQIII
jgi:hypothetical protein